MQSQKHNPLNKTILRSLSCKLIVKTSFRHCQKLFFSSATILKQFPYALRHIHASKPRKDMIESSSKPKYQSLEPKSKKTKGQGREFLVQQVEMHFPASTWL